MVSVGCSEMERNRPGAQREALERRVAGVLDAEPVVVGVVVVARHGDGEALVADEGVLLVDVPGLQGEAHQHLEVLGGLPGEAEVELRRHHHLGGGPLVLQLGLERRRHAGEVGVPLQRQVALAAVVGAELERDAGHRRLERERVARGAAGHAHLGLGHLAGEAHGLGQLLGGPVVGDAAGAELEPGERLDGRPGPEHHHLLVHRLDVELAGPALGPEERAAAQGVEADAGAPGHAVPERAAVAQGEQRRVGRVGDGGGRAQGRVRPGGLVVDHLERAGDGEPLRAGQAGQVHGDGLGAGLVGHPGLGQRHGAGVRVGGGPAAGQGEGRPEQRDGEERAHGGGPHGSTTSDEGRVSETTKAAASDWAWPVIRAFDQSRRKPCSTALARRAAGRRRRPGWRR